MRLRVLGFLTDSGCGYVGTKTSSRHRQGADTGVCVWGVFSLLYFYLPVGNNNLGAPTKNHHYIRPLFIDMLLQLKMG